jgi:predicted peptidase
MNFTVKKQQIQLSPLFALLLFLWFFLSFHGKTSATTLKTIKQESRTFMKEVTRTISGRYLLYLPENYAKDSKKWPLLLFLHGVEERGTNLALLKRHGPPKLVEEGKAFPFILVSPQCPEDEWWNSETLSILLDDVMSRYRVDEQRIYLTGLSMGGFGTWSLAIHEPHRFAAIIPVCGGGNPLEVCKVRHLPIWVFHGAKDTLVPLVKSQEMVDALKKCGSHNVKFTIYPHAGHDAWTRTYNNHEIYQWLLNHKKH